MNSNFILIARHRCRNYLPFQLRVEVVTTEIFTDMVVVDTETRNILGKVVAWSETRIYFNPDMSNINIRKWSSE